MSRMDPSKYNFNKLEFQLRLLDKHFTPMKTFEKRYFVVHHMTIVGTGDGDACEACYQTWQKRQASAQYSVDGPFVMQHVWDKDYAWASGSTKGNLYGIHVEHANSTAGPKWLVAEQTMQTGAKLIAYGHVLYKFGRPVDQKTLFQHDNFFATACPGPYLGGSQWKAYVALVQRYYDNIVSPKAPPDPAPKPPVKVEPVTQVNMIHWNVAGSDTVNGYAKANGYRGDDVARHAFKLGFDIFLTCESSQKNLVKGMNSFLSKFHPWSSRAKTIWYDDTRVKGFHGRKVYAADRFAYLNSRKWGMAFFGKKDGKKFAVLEIHTDYRKPAKQAKQVQNIFKQFRKDCDVLGIKHINQYVCGDFNWDGTSGDNPFKSLSAWKFEEKGNRTSATFLNGRHLDGVLAHESASVKVTVKKRDNGVMRLSDHYPIKFTVTLM